MRTGASQHRGHRRAGRVADRLVLPGCVLLAVAGCGGASIETTSVGAGMSPSPSRVATQATRGVPPSTAGDLDAADLPGSAALGRDWEPFADPGGHEAGFRGNGTWTRERDADTVLLEVTPIGCATAASVPSYPTPVHALEGTYRHPSRGSAVTLLLQFAAPAHAQRFFSGHRAVVTDCRVPGNVPDYAPPRPDIVPRVNENDLLVDVRREYGRGASPLRWTEVVRRSGPYVGMLIVGLPESESQPTPGQLTATMRGSMPH